MQISKSRLLLIFTVLLYALLVSALVSADTGFKPKGVGKKQGLWATPNESVERPIVKHPPKPDKSYKNHYLRDYGDKENDLRRCNGLNNQYIAPPYINIFDVRKSGNVFSDKYKVKGSVEGVCLAEAGYFEQGRKVQDFKIFTTPIFERYEFEVTARGGRHPEIRAYNTNGERYIYSVNSKSPPDIW